MNRKPYKAKGTHCTVRVSILVTPSEKKLLDQRRERTGQATSDFIKSILEKEGVYERERLYAKK